jgi:hypothetical protein
MDGCMSKDASANCDMAPRTSPEEVRLGRLLQRLEDEYQASAGSPARAGGGPVLRPTDRSENWPADELAEALRNGEAGDPASASRAAELLELVEDFSAAQTWWHRAAALGDRDALNYVRNVLEG